MVGEDRSLHDLADSSRLPLACLVHQTTQQVASVGDPAFASPALEARAGSTSPHRTPRYDTLCALAYSALATDLSIPDTSCVALQQASQRRNPSNKRLLASRRDMASTHPALSRPLTCSASRRGPCTLPTAFGTGSKQRADRRPPHEGPATQRRKECGKLAAGTYGAKGLKDRRRRSKLPRTTGGYSMEQQASA